MYNKCYNEKKIYDQSELMFEEVSGGIYRIVKDGIGEFEYGVEYVSSKTVIAYLETNGGIHVAVSGIDGAYVNFRLVDK